MDLTPLVQMLSGMSGPKQATSSAVATPNMSQPAALPAQPSQQGSGNSPIMQWLGGLAKNVGSGAMADGATGAANGLDQGLAFGAAPAGTYGPFQANSALSGLSAGAGATQAAGAGGLSGALAPLLALL